MARNYDQGTRPRVFINWQSFEDWGISPDWKGPFTDAVINAYTRWMQIAGVDLRFQFWNYTTATSANPGELLIQMSEAFGGRLASTFGTYGQLTIVFHRKNSADLSPWPFVPYNASPGQYDMQAILLHEMGHCFGLDHIDTETATMNSYYSYGNMRGGPLRADVAALRGMYDLCTRNRLRQLTSSSGGAWTAANNDLTNSGSTAVRTNITPGAAVMRPSQLQLVGWTLPSGQPTWLRGDGTTFRWGEWVFYGGETSLHGPAYSVDDRGTLLWAWVANDMRNTIKMVRSDDQGASFYWVGVPAGATTFGTPGLCWTRVDGRSTWILVWSHFDVSDDVNTGRIRASISTDDGWSWSAPTTLDTLYKSLSGVSIAATPTNQVLVAFANAPGSRFGINSVVTEKCQVNAGRLDVLLRLLPGDASRTQPALGYDSRSNRYVMAWRNQDFATTISTRTMAPTDLSWSASTWTAQRTNVAPALAYSAERAQAALWYAFED